MITDETIKKQYYLALIEKSSQYEGLFFWGLTSTGIFCRATCPARRPKYENCVFFENKEEAIQRFYRPCKRCQPLVYPAQLVPCIERLLGRLGQHPERRWSEVEIAAQGVDPSTVRRQFKKRFGMTFLAYSRLCRVASALSEIEQGKSVIDTQIKYGFDSSSGFHRACMRIQSAYQNSPAKRLLCADWIDTRLGTMLAVECAGRLCYVNFIDGIDVSLKLKQLAQRYSAIVVPRSSAVLHVFKEELLEYFRGFSTSFSVALDLAGSDVQRQVWQYLVTIPVGEARTFKDLLQHGHWHVKEDDIMQAVNSSPLVIVIPTHRLHSPTQDPAPLSALITRAAWLLAREQKGG